MVIEDGVILSDASLNSSSISGGSREKIDAGDTT